MLGEMGLWAVCNGIRNLVPPALEAFFCGARAVFTPEALQIKD